MTTSDHPDAALLERLSLDCPLHDLRIEVLLEVNRPEASALWRAALQLVDAALNELAMVTAADTSIDLTQPNGIALSGTTLTRG